VEKTPLSKLFRKLVVAEERERRKISPPAPAIKYAEIHSTAGTNRKDVTPAHQTSIGGNIAAEVEHTIDVIKRLRERVSWLSQEYRLSHPRSHLATDLVTVPEEVENDPIDPDDYEEFSIEELEQLIFIGRSKG